MREGYIPIEIARKASNYDRIVEECEMLESDNQLLKDTIRDKDEKYLAVITEKNKRIEELEKLLNKNEQTSLF